MVNLTLLKDAVKSLDENILKACVLCQDIDELYRGCQVFYSPFLAEPEVLFVGLNPGSGYYNEHGHRVQKFDPEERLEYVFSNYRLANEIKEVFMMAQCFDVLNNSIKVNHYYVSTDNEKKLWELLWILKDRIGIDVCKLSKEWTKIILSACNPSVIVCEGKKSFELMLDTLGVCDHDSKWDNGCVLTDFNGIKVVGFRRIYSKIANKERLSSLLKSCLSI